jgi:hypothetical protein
MTLPKIQHPTFRLEVPSTKKTLSFRPFLVKEEKILLMAKASQDPTDILTAIKQIVNNCCMVDNIDVNKFTIFDLEYLFLKIRANSVSNIVELSFRDNEDDKSYDFKVDLNQVKMKYPDDIDNKIAIDDKTGIIMKYPSAEMYDDKNFLQLKEDALFELIVRCIDKIYQGDKLFDPKTHSKEELEAFLDSVDTKTFEKIQNFLNNVPNMEYVISYKNSMGNDRRIELKSLTDFFTLR